MTSPQLAGISVGVTLVVVGLLALGTYLARGAQRRRSNGLMLVSLGAWCALYGLRLLAYQPPFRATLGGTPEAWRYFLAFATYTINVPGILFFVGTLGPGWRRSLQWNAALVITYALAAIAMDLLTGRPGSSSGPNNPIVLVTAGVVLANLLSRRRRAQTLVRDRAVLAGGLILLVFVVNQNLGPLVGASFNLEPIGVLIFVVSLGYAVVRSVVRNEAEFVSVQRELDTARGIQRSLLPRRMPSVTGIDLAVRYVPMTAVAGDFYDVIPISPTAVGVLVADVSGHGIPAALVASIVKVAFAAQSAHAADPAAVLSGMNVILCRHVERAYVTAVYAVVDVGRAAVTFACAGHPPPLLRRAVSSPQPVDGARGVLLGFLPEAEYRNGCVNGLQKGDRLLLYTDGVLEARDRAGSFFDEERAARWLSIPAGSSAEALADHALADLTSWSKGSGFDDDVTFVVVEVT